MNISYLITVHNEGKLINDLLFNLNQFIQNTDDEIVILDDYSTDKITIDSINNYTFHNKHIKHYKHKLNNDYGAHKNYGNSLCKNDWIFQIDGDENPHQDLMLNIKDIISENTGVELFFIPRVNDFIGVTPEHAMKWGWKLSRCPEYDNRYIVSWPDYQGRIYKNDPSRIKWNRRLHEKIEGHVKYSILPAEINLSLYHYKTIDKQIQTNENYNKNFTLSENQGHGVFK